MTIRTFIAIIVSFAMVAAAEGQVLPPAETPPQPRAMTDEMLAQVPGAFPLACRGGMRVISHRDVSERDSQILLAFQKGPRPASQGLAPGECSWLDRGMWTDEHATLCQQIRSVDAASYLSAVGDAARTFTFLVTRDDARNCFNIASVTVGPTASGTSAQPGQPAIRAPGRPAPQGPGGRTVTVQPNLQIAPPQSSRPGAPPPRPPRIVTVPPLTVTPPAPGEGQETVTVVPGIFGEPGGWLARCMSADCSLTNANDTYLDSGDQSLGLKFIWNMSATPGAQGSYWQVSRAPFSNFLGGTAADVSPATLVASGHGDVEGGTNIDFRAAAEAAAAQGASGAQTFYVRVLAVAPKDSTNVLGRPSNTMKVNYDIAEPEQRPFEILVPQEARTPGPQYELVGLQYIAYDYEPKWPPGCKEVQASEGRNALEAVAYAAEKTFEFVSDAYDAVQTAIVDVVDAVTLGAMPRGVWETALQGALIAAGIPPDIPDLNALMSQGADYFASELASQAMGQIPGGQLAEVAGDLGVEFAANMAEEELRRRVRGELQRRSRQAIIDGAQAAANAARERAGPYCVGKSTWPHYLLTLRNTGDQDYFDISIEVSDSEEIFQRRSINVSLPRGADVRVPVMPDPKIREVYKTQSYNYDRSHNSSHWWQEYYHKHETKVFVSGTGDHLCIDDVGPGPPRCYFDSKTLYGSPSPILLNNNRTLR